MNRKKSAHRAIPFIFLLACILPVPEAACQDDTSKIRPFTLSPKREVVFLFAGSALSLGGVFLAEQVEPPERASLDRNDVPRIDRCAIGYHSNAASFASDIVRDAAIGFPIVVSAAIHLTDGGAGRPDFFSDMTMYLESALLSGGLTLIAKGATKRPRPYTFNPDTPDRKIEEKSSARSFWSGHSATAFNGVVFTGYVFQQRRPESKLIIPVWIFGLASATTASLLRVRAGDHFPTDVLAGAAAGSLTGWLVPKMHRRSSGKIGIISHMQGRPGIEVRIRY
ncbi:MAG: phosphatase PAP2 family protein [Candidatus Latescibacterota bacterium]